MARHEFGIIDREVSESENFKEYEPEKYNCISIDDEYIENIVTYFDDIPTYFHRLKWQETGLNYIGITLIPPQSCREFASVLEKCRNSVYDELVSLLIKAHQNNRFVIHYGL